MGERYLIKSQNLVDIADAIRSKRGIEDAIKPREMAEHIRQISGGGVGSIDTEISATLDYDIPQLHTVKHVVKGSLSSPTIFDGIKISALENAIIYIKFLLNGNTKYNFTKQTDTNGCFECLVEDLAYDQIKIDFEETGVFKSSTKRIKDVGKLIARFYKKADTTEFNEGYFYGQDNLYFFWGNEEPTSFVGTSPTITKTTDDPDREYTYKITGYFKGFDEPQTSPLVNYTYLYIPDSVTDHNFMPIVTGTDLKEIRCPNNLTSLGNRYFEYCSKLKKVSLPEALEILPEACFSYCHSLEEIKIPNVHTLDTDSLLRLDNLKHIEFTGFNLTYVNPAAIATCPSLVGVCLPSSVKEIEDTNFTWTPNLIYLEMSRNTEVINYGPKWWAKDSQNLKYLTFPDKLKIVRPTYYPRNCKIERIVLPKSVERIDEQCFQTLSKLKSVKFLSTACPAWGGDPFVFFDNDMGREFDIYLPEGYSSAFDQLFRNYLDRFHIHTFTEPPNPVYVWNVNELTYLNIYLEKISDGSIINLNYDPNEFCYVGTNVSNGDYKLKTNGPSEYKPYERIINIDQSFDNIYLLYLREKPHEDLEKIDDYLYKKNYIKSELDYEKAKEYFEDKK